MSQPKVVPVWDKKAKEYDYVESTPPCLLSIKDEISDEEGERMLMMAESQNRGLTEDEHLIYSL